MELDNLNRLCIRVMDNDQPLSPVRRGKHKPRDESVALFRDESDGLLSRKGTRYQHRNGFTVGHDPRSIDFHYRIELMYQAHWWLTRVAPIISCIAYSFTIKQIAVLMDLAPKTIEYHYARIKRVLNLRNDADVTRYAIRHGYIYFSRNI